MKKVQGILPILFVAQSFLGNFNVSLDSLTLSKFKVFVSICWMFLYTCSGYKWFVIVQSTDTTWTVQHYYELSDCIAVLYVLLSSIIDHKTQVSAWLNLQMAQEILKSKEVKIVSENNWSECLFAMNWIFKILFMVTYSYVKLFTEKIHHSLHVILFLHTFSVQVTTESVYFAQHRMSLHLSSCVRKHLQMSENHRAHTSSLRRVLPVEVTRSGLCESLRNEIFSVMRNNQMKIQNTFWPYMVWKLLKSATYFPIMLYYYWLWVTLRGETDPLSAMSIYMVFVETVISTLMFVHLSEKGFEESHKTHKVLQRNCKRKRTQLLARIHCPRFVTCYLFDLEYSLLMELADTSFLVLTSLSSN